MTVIQKYENNLLEINQIELEANLARSLDMRSTSK